jgi:hypothetical protein
MSEPEEKPEKKTLFTIGRAPQDAVDGMRRFLEEDESAQETLVDTVALRIPNFIPEAYLVAHLVAKPDGTSAWWLSGRASFVATIDVLATEADNPTGVLHRWAAALSPVALIVLFSYGLGMGPFARREDHFDVYLPLEGLTLPSGLTMQKLAERVQMAVTDYLTDQTSVEFGIEEDQDGLALYGHIHLLLGSDPDIDEYEDDPEKRIADAVKNSLFGVQPRRLIAQRLSVEWTDDEEEDY